MRNGITIYCIRHGQTDWNAESRYQGQADIPLNDTGRTQATRNGKALAALMPAIADADFVASPLSRTCETMRLARAAMGLAPDEFSLDDRLREVHYGHWEGQLLADLPTTDPEGLSARLADPFNWRPEGGESYSDLMDRLVDWLQTVERDTVMATHGGISRTLRGHCLGVDMNGILQMEVPQDRVLVIRSGQMRWI